MLKHIILAYIRQRRIVLELLFIIALIAFELPVSIAAWTLILTEAYWRGGQAQVSFRAAIIFSCLAVSGMAFPIGILFSYWRS
ncbi:MAG: hypothetical protein ABSF77_08885 [Spirochaetia bacterium]|jgi:hypothetical protein